MPHFQDKLCRAGDKDCWDEGVPLDGVDWRGVGGVGHEILGGVLGGRQVNLPLLCTHLDTS